MQRRWIVAAAGLAVAMPGLAAAEGLPPHSSYYGEQAHWNGKGNQTELVVNRPKGTADVYASNPCLGQVNGYAGEAQARGVHLVKGKLHYDGPATVYTQAGGHTVRLKISAVVKAKQTTGTVSFPGTKGCQERTFVAALRSSTK